MKKTLLLILVLYACNIFFGTTENVNAQNRQPLEVLLKKIEQTYGARFVYEKNLLDGVSVSYSLQGKSSKRLETVLKEVLYPQGYLFLFVEENYYTIVKDTRSKAGTGINAGNPAVPSATGNVPPGKRTVTGKITDNRGLPLPGAGITPEGSKYGVSSSSDGTFSITFDKSYKTLVFSFIGMISQRRELEEGSMYNISLMPDENTLQEIEVVSTGYEKLPKERATGSFGLVSAKEIAKTPAINLMERLEGKVPGVKFDLRNNTINIRGQNTYSAAGSQPLIVIDGFPLISESDETTKLTKQTATTGTGFAAISRINPNDIESVTFLKDAAAASIWGARAANGVIVIETKKGSRKEPGINFSSSLSISSPANLNRVKSMTSAQYIDLEAELADKGFITDPASWTPGYYTFNTNANTSEALEWMFRVKRGTASTAQRDSALTVLSGRNNKSQISKYLMQKAVTQQYNLSVSGGGENNTYYIAANSANDRPVYKNNSGQSYNLTANSTNDFFKKRITLSTGINYNHTYSKGNTAASTAIGSSTLGLRPYEMLVDENGQHVDRSILFRPEVLSNFSSLGYLPWTYNSIDELDYSNSITKEDRVRLNAALKGRITNWLDADLSGTYQHVSGATVNEDELDSYNARNLLNTATSISNGKLVYGIPLGGIYRTSNTSNTDYSVRGNFSVHKTWNDQHQLTMIGGAEIRQTLAESYGQTRYGFDDDTYTSKPVNPTVYYQTIYPYTAQLGYLDGKVSLIKRRYLSYFSNASYAYKGKYMASASVRFEDYTQMGADASLRGKPLWSGGLKWNIKQEDFMKPVSLISDLALRLTYGTGGSIPTGGYNSTIIAIPGTAQGTNETYATINYPANSLLSWEETRQFNTGIDLAMFKNRLQLNFDLYSKRSKGIVVDLPYNATYGWSTLRYNAASLSSHGVEFGLQGDVLRSRDFGWRSNFTFSYNTNKVTDARFAQPTGVSIATTTTPIVGYSLDYLYVYRWAGLDNTGQSQVYNQNGDIVKSTEGNNALTAADLKYAGRRTAPYFGGWTNDFSYKNFTLDVMISYYLGHKFLKSSVDNYPSYTGVYYGVLGTQADLADRWRNPGDEAFTNVPGLSNISTNSLNRYKYSDLLVRSASNIRLQQISLAYAIPAVSLKRSPFKSLSASLSVRNLGIIWRKNKDGIDPDYVNTGSYSNLPPTRNYVLGLNAGF